ncbi:Fe3+/spermidine/putrescine ABC transporter ATP-binding protein [Rhodosalinus halophilus]|uniref:Spermidine/putrescine import ATP-binding protein PotA n=1 Tax=Rhodosalinus halophilus TaxID=2259333 RepID=A0A365U6V5_9RHOB|nr:ABC transporter ATP-binding protein [Rhodosalinus halophilus]RBI83488.1 Fe3+/spermidine/putrescine ABC transporter ATP-binding protein [Rhodosalinus halophilus]
MTQDAYIRIENVTKRFGSFTALGDVSMDIREGEFFSLLGASGCGKTTLLRLLAGFESPTEGEIYLDGDPISGVPPNHRPVNMVFQSYAIFPHLDVRDNIAYGLRKRKLPKARRDEMVDEMLHLIKLPDYGDRRANQLSGGQRQRVALARALILRPKVLLLDEPLGALDKNLREQMQLELRQIQRTVGITFVFVTHDQEEALTLSDRMAVMARGKPLQIDTPEALYERPANREVAEFIGSMNFFEGRVTQADGQGVDLDVAALGRIAAPDGAGGLSPGQRVALAIRPEKIALSDTRPERGHAVRGRIQNAAYLGERSHYYVQLDGIEAPVAVSANNSAPVRHVPEAGEVWLSWPDEAMRVLAE